MIEAFLFFIEGERNDQLTLIAPQEAPFGAPCWPGWLLHCPVQEDQAPRLVSCHVSLTFKVILWGWRGRLQSSKKLLGA